MYVSVEFYREYEINSNIMYIVGHSECNKHPLLIVVQKRASYGLADCGHVIRHSGYYHHTIIIIMSL